MLWVIVVWWLGIPIAFILAHNCLSRWIWHLQASGNCTQGWTRLVEVHSSLPDILADFFRFSHTQGSSVFEVCPKIHPQAFFRLTQVLSVKLSEAAKAMTTSSWLSQTVLGHSNLSISKLLTLNKVIKNSIKRILSLIILAFWKLK